MHSIHKRTGRVPFGEGGGGGVAEISCPNIFFSPLLARKSSCFTRILPENGYLKNYRGLQPP